MDSIRRLRNSSSLPQARRLFSQLNYTPATDHSVDLVGPGSNFERRRVKAARAQGRPYRCGLDVLNVAREHENGDRIQLTRYEQPTDLVKCAQTLKERQHQYRLNQARDYRLWARQPIHIDGQFVGLFRLLFDLNLS